MQPPHFAPLDPVFLKQRLEHPGRKVSLVLDTDTYNEVDDQFALAYALRSPEAVDLEAVYAAPFHNNRSSGPADGMERSYGEIVRVLERMRRPLPEDRVYKGSGSYLPGEGAVDSPAARNLVERAMARSPEEPPLVVAAIGAVTNVASALLMDPRIRERILLLWLGGHARFWPTALEFNLGQDLRASRIVFDCGVPLIWFPCIGMASHLTTTLAELERDLEGHSAIGDYLVDIVRDYPQDHFAWSKVIWDIAPIAWLIQPDWAPSRLAPSPILDEQGRWQSDAGRPPVREMIHIQRDPVFRDLFHKLRDA